MRTRTGLCSRARARALQSILLSLAVLENRITPRQAVDLSRVEEEYQIGIWGMVEGGHDLDRNYANVQVLAASSMIKMLRSMA